MITKRTVLGVKERVHSARTALLQMIYDGKVSRDGIHEIVNRDLDQASTDLDYILELAD